MRQLIALVTVMVFLGLILAEQVCAGDEKKAEESAAKTEKTVEKETKTVEKPSLLGKWVITPTKYILSGTIVFNENGTFEQEEVQADTTGVGISGQYIIDMSAEPYTIDLCPGKCNQPGSEWTTTFGIFRFLPDGGVEIASTGGKDHPKKFPEKPGFYSLFLTREKTE